MNDLQTPEYIAAKNRVASLKKYYRQLIVFIIVAGAFLAYKYVKNGEIKFNESIWICIWGIVVLIKTIKLLIFDSNWETKQLKKELSKYE